MEKSRSRGRVLLVDDEVTLLRGVARQLKRAGYDVEAFTRGAPALEALAGGGFDVVVSDISMPGMDGITLLRSARERGLDLPVVLVSGAPGLQTTVEALEFGVLECLTKPVRIKRLMATIAQAVRLHRLARTEREAVGDEMKTSETNPTAG